MATGLVLGKFLPPHAGHLHLIHTALAEVGQLNILVCSLAREPVAGELRVAWLRELVPAARIIHLTDDNPSFPDEHADFWNIWLRSIRRVLPEGPDLVYTSERYGDELARRLGARHRLVDPARQAFPVSGSLVRSDPDRYWPFIPPPVRPHFVARVVLTGSESTGKTTLARQLAERFQTSWIAEYGREYAATRPAPLTAADIEPIAHGQIASEEQAFRGAPRGLVFLDTDLLTTEVYADHYFGACPDWVRQAARGRLGHLYLLTAPDILWRPDPGQRDRGHRREEMQGLFAAALRRHQVPVAFISGEGEQRLSAAVEAVESLLARRWPYQLPLTLS